MPAYNFKPRFIEPIKAGTKTQTIRPVGRRRHARPGERIQLYTGMRTSVCKKILERDPICISVQSCVLDFRGRVRPVIVVDGRQLSFANMIEFAKRDGFDSLKEMGEMFCEIYGPLRDGMVVIRWGVV
jgi:hypothetical protein